MRVSAALGRHALCLKDLTVASAAQSPSTTSKKKLPDRHRLPTLAAISRLLHDTRFSEGLYWSGDIFCCEQTIDSQLWRWTPRCFPATRNRPRICVSASRPSICPPWSTPQPCRSYKTQLPDWGIHPLQPCMDMTTTLIATTMPC